MVNHVTVSVEVDPDQVKSIVEAQLKEITAQQLLYIDVNKALELTCMSKRFAQDYVLSHPKMVAIERRRDRKRLYPYKEFVEVLKEIVDSW